MYYVTKSTLTVSVLCNDGVTRLTGLALPTLVDSNHPELVLHAFSEVWYFTLTPVSRQLHCLLPFGAKSEIIPFTFSHCKVGEYNFININLLKNLTL